MPTRSSGRGCVVELENRSGAPLSLQSAVKWDTDDWSPSPDGSSPIGDGGSTAWRTLPGFMRGCHNELTWTVGGEGGPKIRIERTERVFGADEPNTCTSSDPAYVCVGFGPRRDGSSDPHSGRASKPRAWRIERAVVP